MPILKKVCVYKNLDRLFYLCVNVLKSESAFTTAYSVDNSLSTESFLNVIKVYSNQISSEVMFKAFISIQNTIAGSASIPKPVIKYVFLDNAIVSRLPIRALGFEIPELLNISSKAEFTFVLPERLKIVLSPLVSITLKPSTSLEISDYLTLLTVIALNMAESIKTSSSASLPLTYLAKSRTNINIADAKLYILITHPPIKIESTESLVIEDVLRYGKIIVNNITESLNISSSSLLLSVRTLASSESLMLSDSLNYVKRRLLNASENVRTSDVLQYIRKVMSNLSESITASSSSTLARTRYVTLTESFITRSSASLMRIRRISASESVIVSDSLVKKYLKSLTESVRVSSSASFTRIISSSENVKVSDLLNYVKRRLLNASESIIPSDSIAKKLIKTLSESVSVRSSASITRRRI
jgi:hypothetical protein